MEKQNKLNISYNNRLLFIGKTRSGKTYLSNYLLKQFLEKENKGKPDKPLQVIIIDPKHELKRFGDGSSLDKPKLVKTYDKHAIVQVFQCFTWNDALEKMVDAVLKRGKVVVKLDELGGLATATQVPSGITRLWTQGGGMGVGSWALIQFPKRTPLVIKSQSEVFFMFRITSLDDRKAILDFIPDEKILSKALPKRYFWVYKDEWDSATLAKPISCQKKFHLCMIYKTR
jgi:hypothetical protein